MKWKKDNSSAGYKFGALIPALWKGVKAMVVNDVETRLSWVNLKPENFDYWTHYENSSHCKPNPDYYREILKVLGIEAEKCLNCYYRSEIFFSKTVSFIPII